VVREHGEILRASPVLSNNSLQREEVGMAKITHNDPLSTVKRVRKEYTEKLNDLKKRELDVEIHRQILEDRERGCDHLIEENEYLKQRVSDLYLELREYRDFAMKTDEVMSWI
jgi:hypothetical protein